MFERFTDRARRVVVLSQEESRRLKHRFIGTEHILLGLLAEGEGVAAQALAEFDITSAAVRCEVLERDGWGDGSSSGHIPFTPQAKKVFELSLREALQLGHNYIGTEHVLLGLVREGEDVGAQILVTLGADLSLVRQQVIRILSGYQGSGVSARDPRPRVDIDLAKLVEYVAEVLADPTLQNVIAGRVYNRIRQESVPDQQAG
jgi:ATP-dependent Clp protease ATP-binding subunit ClpC